MYMIAVQGWGGGRETVYVSNVLDTKGEGVGGGFPPTVETFWKFGY